MPDRLDFYKDRLVPSFTRRHFIAATCAGSAALVTAGCGFGKKEESWPPAASGTFELDLADYPELSQPGQATLVNVPRLMRSVVITRHPDNTLHIYDSWCTHQGCKVRLVRNELHCPCHNSMYDLEGQVVRGPSKHPLVEYGFSLQGSRLTIHLSEAERR